MREGAAGHLFSFFSYLRRFSFLLFVGAPIALGFRCFWYFLGGTPQRAQFFQKFVWHEIDDGQPEWSRGGAGPGQSAPPREHEEAAPAPETALKTARVRAGSIRSSSDRGRSAAASHSVCGSRKEAHGGGHVSSGAARASSCTPQNFRGRAIFLSQALSSKLLMQMNKLTIINLDSRHCEQRSTAQVIQRMWRCQC